MNKPLNAAPYIELLLSSTKTPNSYEIVLSMSESKGILRSATPPTSRDVLVQARCV